ncbi:MAG: hypothetical protein HY548_04705 [Elusimicrobia bacterium]|nr:hypothetical protein [Elusimicrobiota bacterium]
MTVKKIFVLCAHLFWVACVRSWAQDTDGVVATTLQINNSKCAAAGVDFLIEVRAVDAQGRVDQDAGIVVRVSAALVNPLVSSPSGKAPIYPPDTALARGYAAIPVKPFAAQPHARVAVTYVSGEPDLSGLGLRNSQDFRVDPGDIPQKVDMGSIQTAGLPFPVRVTLGTDVYGNPAQGGAFRISGAEGRAPGTSIADEGNASLAPVYSSPQTYGTDMFGIATFTVTLYRAETGRQIAVSMSIPEESTLTVRTPGLSGLFDVIHAAVIQNDVPPDENATNTTIPPGHLHLFTPARATAGVLFTSSVTVHDAFNNAVPDYAGFLRFETSPPSARNLLPGDLAAPGGSASASFTLFVPGPNVVRAFDPAASELSDEGRIDLALTSLLSDAVAFPSPYRPQEGPLTFRFYTETEAPVKAAIYNFASEKLWEWETFSDQLGPERLKLFTWSGKDDRGHDVPPGAYTCVIKVGEGIQKIKFGVIQ